MLSRSLPLRIVWALVVNILLSTILIGCLAEENASSRETIPIGTVLPLTGDYAEYGANVLAALQIGQEEINRSGTPRIRIIAEDDQAEPAKAVSALEKLIQVDRVRFVIGGFTSGSSLAMYPVAERSGVLMFSPSSSSPNLTENTPLFFRNWPTDREQARFFAHQTFEVFKKHSAALLYSNSEYGVNAKSFFREAYEKLGGQVVVEEAYEPKATNFRPQIRRFLAQPAECVWLFGYYTEMGHFLRQGRELGLRTQFFGQEGIEGEQLLAIAGEAADGVIYFVPAFDPSDATPRVSQFVSAFKAKTGREPEVFAAHAYDALSILVHAIRTVGPNPQKVAAYLPSVRDYPGVAGLTSIDENGDARKTLLVKIISKGSFVRFQ